jgi:hypothetical protein
MKHLRDLAWHPSWDETAKQLATQAAGAAVAFVRLRTDAEWADLCVQALRSLGGDAEADADAPRAAARRAVAAEAAQRLLSALDDAEQGSLILDTAAWRLQQEAEALLGGAAPEVVEAEELAAPPREGEERRAAGAAGCGVGTLVRGVGSTGARGTLSTGRGTLGRPARVAPLGLLTPRPAVHTLAGYPGDSVDRSGDSIDRCGSRHHGRSRACQVIPGILSTQLQE